MITASDLSDIALTALTFSLAYTIIQSFDNYWFSRLERKLKAYIAERELANDWDEGRMHRLRLADLSLKTARLDVDKERFVFTKIALCHAAICTVAIVFFAASAKPVVDPYVLILFVVGSLGPCIVVPYIQYQKTMKTLGDVEDQIEKI